MRRGSDWESFTDSGSGLDSSPGVPPSCCVETLIMVHFDLSTHIHTAVTWRVLGTAVEVLCGCEHGSALLSAGSFEILQSQSCVSLFWHDCIWTNTSVVFLGCMWCDLKRQWWMGQSGTGVCWIPDGEVWRVDYAERSMILLQNVFIKRD